MTTDLQSPRTAPGESPPATLLFLPGWRNIQQAHIVPGRTLTIEYDQERLPHCRLNWRGAEVWDIEVCIKFHPGGQRSTGSVLEQIREPPEFGVVVELRPKRYAVVVPMDATRVELWFRNFYQYSSGCEAWDSRYGANYWYDVVRE
jgi:hypothetical protein